MFKTILVPLDGSELASRALPYGALLARAANGHVILLHAASRRAAERAANPEADIILEHEQRAARLRQEGVSAAAHVVEGDPATAIVQAIADLHADLVVMSTHGRGGIGRIVRGSNVDHLLRHAEVPVLVVTPRCDRTWVQGQPMRVLIPLEGSSLSEEAIHPALELAQSLSIEFRLFRVVPERFEINALGFAETVPVTEADLTSARQYLEAVAAPLRQAGHGVTIMVETGRPADAIERITARDEIDLVVMATHGQGGLGRLLVKGMATVVTAGRVPLHLGSVTEHSIRRLTVPVLLVTPTSIRGDGAPPADGAPTVPRAELTDPAG